MYTGNVNAMDGFYTAVERKRALIKPYLQNTGRQRGGLERVCHGPRAMRRVQSSGL